MQGIVDNALDCIQSFTAAERLRPQGLEASDASPVRGRAFRRACGHALALALGATHHDDAILHHDDATLPRDMPGQNSKPHTRTLSPCPRSLPTPDST